MSLSKAFKITMDGLNCNDVYHPGESCLQMHLNDAKQLLPALATYFVPLVFIPLFRNLHKIGWTDIRQSLYLYLTMIGSVSVASVLSFGGFCLTRKLLGKFYMWSIVSAPILVGNIAVFLLPQKGAGFFANTIVANVIESLFMRDNKWYWKLINTSRSVRTAMFMILSAAIMDTGSRVKNDVFWFLQSPSFKPIPDNEQSKASPVMDSVCPCNRRVCQHEGGCDNHIKSGFKTYLNIGFILEIVRVLFKSFPLIKAKPWDIFHIFTSKVKLRVIAFLVGYATSYRMLGCTLSRLYGKPTAKSNILAGLLSGGAYMIYPNLAILAHATASAAKLIWMRLAARDSGDGFSLIRAINSLPLAQLVYMVFIMYGFHIRTFYPHSTSPFIHKTTQYTSGMRFDRISENIASVLMGFKPYKVIVDM